MKDKEITKIVPIYDTAQEMLRMEFDIDYEGIHEHICKDLLIPSYVDPYHLFINGKEVLPQKQIVDMSTYTQKNSVKLKTTLTPIDMYREEVKGGFTNTQDLTVNINTYILNLFSKKINPLYYYFARFGVSKTIRYFGFEGIIDITTKEYDNNIFYYFRINKELFVECDKRYFDESDFIRTFTYMVYDLFQTKTTVYQVDDIDYWCIRLGAIFTTNTKNQLNKGKNVLVSFNRILDNITRSTLRLDKKHLQSTHSLVRWMLQNYTELRKKDNHDLNMKRVRCNEVIAFLFIQSMSHRINSLLNKKKLTIKAIERIFNWNPDELFHVILSNGKDSLLKYDADINCFELLNALRFSFLGSQGISGGKHIGDHFRDIYPSHLGRIDLNGISHGKNTALTGFLVPKCKIYGNGFFSENTNDPDIFSNYMGDLHKKLYSIEIEQAKGRINELKKIIADRVKAYNSLLTMDKDEYGHIIIGDFNKNLLLNYNNMTYMITRDGEMLKHYSIDGLMLDKENHILVRSSDKLKRDKYGRFIVPKLNNPALKLDEYGHILIPHCG